MARRPVRDTVRTAAAAIVVLLLQGLVSVSLGGNTMSGRAGAAAGIVKRAAGSQTGLAFVPLGSGESRSRRRLGQQHRWGSSTGGGSSSRGRSHLPCGLLGSSTAVLAAGGTMHQQHAAEAKGASSSSSSSTGGGGGSSGSSSSSSSRLAALRRPKVIFVLGGPGAGKGTQCDKLVRDYNLVHLSAGELLRRERSSGSPDGNLIEEYITQGKIVPVRISLSLLKREMEGQHHGCSRFLIDGFPRNFDNVEGWEDVMGPVADVEAVLALDCPEDVLTERLVKRGETSGRSDDNVATALKRFKTYQEATRPVIDYYERQGKVVAVAGQLPPEQVYERLQARLLPIFHKEVVDATSVLLSSISEGDWSVYSQLCDPAMTCFEPEAQGQLVHGLDFHRFYFEHGNSLGRPHTSTMTQPRVQMLGRGSAVISYVRVVQAYDEASQRHSSAAYEETRVWQWRSGRLVCVHFHRSPASSP